MRIFLAGLMGIGAVMATQTLMAAPANPLLGRWVLDMPVQRNSDGVDYCAANPAFIFTPKTEIMFGPASPGQAPPQGKNDVIYMISGKTVYVSAMPPGFVDAPQYTLIGPNEMQAGQIGNCRYKRQ